MSRDLRKIRILQVCSQEAVIVIVDLVLFLSGSLVVVENNRDHWNFFSHRGHYFAETADTVRTISLESEYRPVLAAQFRSKRHAIGDTAVSPAERSEKLLWAGGPEIAFAHGARISRVSG